MRDAQRGEGALELRAGIAAIGGEREGQAVKQKGAAKMLEVVPGGVGRNKDGG